MELEEAATGNNTGKNGNPGGQLETGNNTGKTGNPSGQTKLDDNRKRGLPESAEKSAPAPPTKKTYADKMKVNDGRVRVTVCKLVSGDVENLTQMETDKLVDQITLDSWDLAEPIRIHKSGLYGGRATVVCADETAVKWIKELVPKIDKTWSAFKPGEGFDQAEFGGLIPAEITRIRTVAQVANKIGQNLNGAKIRVISAFQARTKEADKKAGRNRDGQYVRIGMSREAAERLLSMGGIVWLGPFKVTFKLKRHAAPAALDLEDDLINLGINSPRDGNL